ncbi:MAG TPA: ATPase [Bacteroidetes bacterium]|nr:ATPase [Bacteroidota bacterium]
MILLADSGSTKCDWLLLDKSGNRIDAFATMGFNPFFHSATFIVEELAKQPATKKIAAEVQSVYYFGAACSQETQKAIVVQALSTVFPNARIKVEHDMKAAAYAAYQGEPCICCILGTGSNAAYFDGQNLTSNYAGLGYILGDEASGSYFGKKLLAAYLYKQLPESVALDLEKEYGVNRAVILHHVYEKPHANIYLAGFTPFITKYKDLPVFDAILYEGMKTFLQIHVCSFKGYEKMKVHFVGSIAFHFQDSLRKAAAELHIQPGQIIQAPIGNLLAYHQRYVFPQEL